MLEAEVSRGIREGEPDGQWATFEPDGTGALTLRGGIEDVKAAVRLLRDAGLIPKL